MRKGSLKTSFLNLDDKVRQSKWSSFTKQDFGAKIDVTWGGQLRGQSACFTQFKPNWAALATKKPSRYKESIGIINGSVLAEKASTQGGRAKMNNGKQTI